METYSLLREFADSWVLLAMFLFFVGVAIWAFLPSQKSAREDASMIPFRNENGASKGRADLQKKATFAGDLKGQRDV